ncbi:MAG TPA: NAD(P)/FAD-dependent oxidoreductase [Chitinophagaceae bacterium]|nr:NAD(P)/FAD-dependent oxidoreductase [Chitinophagaceae bacterium]
MHIVKKTGNIIIAGGGAAGLMAAKELSGQGYPVIILEASDRLGGRIHTVRNSSFKQPIEKGVEFIHGNLPLTIQILKEAGIGYSPAKGNMIRVINDEWKNQDDFTLGWEEIMRRMNEVREDITMDEFLKEYFSDEKYEGLRRSVIRFSEGFDAADTRRASLLALREEWMSEEGEQYRIHSGYDQLVNYLEKKCLESGCVIHTSSAVVEIKWQRDAISVTTSEGSIFYGEKIIIAVPLGQLQKKETIIFEPEINSYLEAAKNIGYGSVVKIMLEFKEAFWEEKKKNIGFILSNEVIPTWWTQSPSSYPLLTGWAGGPQAWSIEKNDDETILDLALQSLSNIFKKSVLALRGILTASLVANWSKDPYSNGAYSYSLPGYAEIQKRFNTPIEDTIFFAGEAFYEGASPGTVEAALVSGKNAAGKIMKKQLEE